MNGNLYQNPTFPSSDSSEYKDIEEKKNNASINDYSEIIDYNYVLKSNIGKKVKAYASYPNSSPWQSKIYDGIIEQVGYDYLIIKNAKDGVWHLIKTCDLDSIEFEERISY